MAKMHTNWHVLTQRNGDPEGKNLTMDNFRIEDKGLSDILVREVGQNILDARAINSSDGKLLPVTLKINVYKNDSDSGFDFTALDSITKNILPHLDAAGHDLDLLNGESKSVLLVEEFNTTGLSGSTDESSYTGKDPKFQRWNAFWYGEGLEIKNKKDLGKKGQGKITYHLMSGSSCVFALSNQQDGLDNLLFGKCEFKKTHKIDGKPYARKAYYCDLKDGSSSDPQPVPISDSLKVKRFKESFKITRNKEHGTSWIIPFVPDKLDHENIITSFIKEFYIALTLGTLILEIGGKRIDSGNIIDVMSDCIDIEEREKQYIRWLITAIKSNEKQIIVKEGWFVAADKAANSNSIEEKEFKTAVDLFDQGKTLSFYIPINIKFINDEAYSGYISIYLKKDYNLSLTIERYVRECLIIEDERWLNNISGKYYGAAIISDSTLMEFLGNAEEASHIKWNHELLRDCCLYVQPKESLSEVRRALPAFAKLLSGEVNQRSEDILSDILSIPVYEVPKVKKSSPKPPPQTPTPPSPPPVPDALIVNSDKVGVVELLPGAGFSALQYPCYVKLLFAYEPNGEGDAFKDYMHFDFDLSSKEFSIHGTGFNIISQDLNLLEIVITEQIFNLVVSGFTDDKLVVKVRHDEN